MADAVRIEGLAQLRRDLRRMQPETLREVRGVLKDAATVVARRAQATAPKRTGNLADSYRAGTAGNTAFVRSRLPYAGVHEYGGTIRPRGTPIVIKRSAPITTALRDNEDQIVKKVSDGMDRVARRNGWR
ncbi:MAG: HK97 gp10 family phage protein [Solirubrobacteraceae bacterium]|nr:HK97 gp10 family phage protein [Solirubrobacteraceae bacterium]